MHTHPSRLDADSLAYLQSVEATAGTSHDGVYICRGASWFSGPRGGWFLYLVLGLAGLVAAGALCWPPLLDQLVPEARATTQAVLAGLGILLLSVGVVRYRRAPGPIRRSFLFADALHLWEVTPDRVEATELTDLRDVDGSHHSNNGAYTHSLLSLTFSARRRSVQVSGKQAAERLLNFLQVLISVRTSDDEDLRHMALLQPGRLGSLAHHLAVHGSASAWPGPSNDSDPPRPHIIDAGQAPPVPGWKGTLVRCLVAGGVGAAGYFAFPLLDRICLDVYLFSQVPVRGSGQAALDQGIRSADRYLAAFPSSGMHTREVVELRDDWLYDRAAQEAKTQDSPRSLRDYLANQENQRHRPEALKLIGGFYDRTIADLKKSAQANEKKIDQNLFQGVLSLLEALKKAPSPVITVGFKGEFDEAPSTPEQKKFEQFVYDLRVK
jgi:hypothetical protein